MKAAVFGLLFVPWHALAAPVLWNITTGPMPPYQPKEMGVETLTIQHYTADATGEVFVDINLPGFIFNSYSQLSAMATTGGEVDGVPQLQVAYNNFNDPSSPTATLLAYYNTQTCMSGPIEGDSPYNGYDYYTNLLLSLYYSGTPIYFQYVELPDYGTCLQYTATPPWPFDDLPRDLKYTVTFQQSTGYHKDPIWLVDKLQCISIFLPHSCWFFMLPSHRLPVDLLPVRHRVLLPRQEHLLSQ